MRALDLFSGAAFGDAVIPQIPEAIGRTILAIDAGMRAAA